MYIITTIIIILFSLMPHEPHFQNKFVSTRINKFLELTHHNLSVACWSCKFHLLSKFVSQTFKSKNQILSIELCCDDISLTFYSSLSFCILHPKSPISPWVSIPWCYLEQSLVLCLWFTLPA